MLSLPFYLLLTISIVSNCANAYVLDGSVSMNDEDKSQTNEKRSALFDGNNSSSSNRGSAAAIIANIARNANDADNRIGTSTWNVTAIDSSIDMPQPNAAIADAITFQTSRDSSDTFAEVETGTVHLQPLS